MIDSTRKGGTPAQYAAGILLSLVGGFFAVSIVLALAGREPSPGVLTSAVVELDLLLGSLPALVLSIGVAVIGALFIVRDEPPAAGRLLSALALCALGFAGLLGMAGRGGQLGAIFPELLTGFVGKVLDLALGGACLWGGWSLLLGGRGPRSRSVDVTQHIGLGSRAEAASGVTAAEAALLVTEPRTSTPRPVVRREEAKPLTDETIRPFLPRKEVPEPVRTRRVDPPPVPRAPAEAAVKPLTARTPEPPLARAETAPAPAPEAALTPSWELDDELVASVPVEPLDAEEEGDEEGEEADTLELEAELDEEPERVAAQGALEDDELLEDEEEFDDFEETADEDAAPIAELPPIAASADAPSASWEQVGLFDEEEAEEEHAPGGRAASARELTQTFDFEPEAPARSRTHEPEQDEPEPAEVEPPAAPAVERRAAATPPPAPVGEFVLAPMAAPAPARAAPLPKGDEGERWRELVFEAGCAILEQKRVAVSMLERRFGIDFDQACRVLDELQQSGLIGPYMGGRTRDILLSREEWLAQAPHAS